MKGIKQLVEKQRTMDEVDDQRQEFSSSHGQLQAVTTLKIEWPPATVTAEQNRVPECLRPART